MKIFRTGGREGGREGERGVVVVRTCVWDRWRDRGRGRERGRGGREGRGGGMTTKDQVYGFLSQVPDLEWFPRLRCMSLDTEDGPDQEQNEMKDLQKNLAATTSIVRTLSLQLNELKDKVHGVKSVGQTEVRGQRCGWQGFIEKGAQYK